MESDPKISGKFSGKFGYACSTLAKRNVHLKSPFQVYIILLAQVTKNDTVAESAKVTQLVQKWQRVPSYYHYSSELSYVGDKIDPKFQSSLKGFSQKSLYAIACDYTFGDSIIGCICIYCIFSLCLYFRSSRFCFWCGTLAQYQWWMCWLLLQLGLEG